MTLRIEEHANPFSYLTKKDNDGMPEGYKQTEIGVIPTEWFISKLRDIFEFKNGLNKEKQYFGYGTPIINYMDVYKTGGIYAYDVKGKVFVDSAEKKNYSAQKGDVFFTRTSETVDEIGLASVLLTDLEEAVFSGFVLRARQRSEFLIAQYMKFCFRAENVRKQIQSSASYTTRALTNGTLLGDVLLPVPPKEEQAAIANALSDVDALIQELEKLIAKKQAIKTATMQQLLTGRTRLPQFAHHPDGRKKGYKLSELGEIPEDWEVVQINQCTDLITKGTTPMTIGKAFVPQGITFVKVESINESGRLDFTKFAFIDEETDKLLARSRIKENDLLISIAGALGRAAIVKHEILPANTNQALAIVRLNKDSEISLNFLYHFTKTTLFKKCIDEIASQGAQPNLSLGDLGAFKIVVPNREEQKTISDMLSVIDQEIQVLEQRLNKTRQIKQGMMQELLTGKTRLVKPAGVA